MPVKDLPPEARPREKLLARGAAALSDTELLAIILRTGIAGRSVLALAGDLLRLPARNGAPADTSPPSRAAGAAEGGGFGGLNGLLHARHEDLARIKGLGPAKRAELLAIMELARRALAQQLQAGDALASPAAARSYLQAQLAHRPHEVFAVVFLDAQMRMIAFEELFRGTLTHTQVYPREIALRALHWHAESVILAHNHPSGSVQPSPADVSLTRHIRDALALLGIHVRDHIIVAQGQSCSLADSGVL